MLAHRTLPHRKMAQRFLLFLGLVGAVSLVLATHRSLLVPIPWRQVNTPWQQGCGPDGCYTVPINISPFVVQESMLLTMLALILYCWLRGMKIVREGNDSQESAMTSFKWRFSILLTVLALAVFDIGSTRNVLLASLTIALPLFFLSSLLTLSLTGLLSGDVRGLEEQTSSTRLWTTTLPVLWVAALVVVMMLEVFVFPLLLALFQPLWNGIEEAIVVALNWLASLQHQPPVIRPLSHHHIENNPVGPPMHPSIWLLVILSIISIVLLVLLVVFLLRQFTGSSIGIDGGIVKERLSWRKLWRQRRRRRRSAAFKLESLEPASVRAQYRAFLLAMASQGQELARSPEETPDEYQTRLLAPFRQGADSETTSAPASLLADLTSAYNRERYGGAQTSLLPYHRRQISRLVKQLKKAPRKE